MAFAQYQKTAPYGKGEADGRTFADGTDVCTLAVDYITIVDPECFHVVDVHKQARANNGAHPGQPLANANNYVVSKVVYTHALARDDASGACQWDTKIYIEPNPLKLMPKVEFQATHYKETVTNDAKTNQPILNKAGEPFAQAIEENKGRLRFEATKYVAPTDFYPDDFTRMLFAKSKNAVSFKWRGQTFGYDANQLYCADLRMPFFETPVPHFQVTASFEVDRGDDKSGGGTTYWVRHPLNLGYRYKDSSGKLTQFTCKGVTHGGQGALDGNGGKLADGGTPIVLDVETIPEVDFNQFKIFPGQ